MPTLQLSLPHSLDNRIREEAERTGKSLSEVAREWISRGMKVVVENDKIMKVLPAIAAINWFVTYGMLLAYVY